MGKGGLWGALVGLRGSAPDRPDVGQPTHSRLSGSAGPGHIPGRAPCPTQSPLAARNTAMGRQPRRWWQPGQGPGGSDGLSASPQAGLLPKGTRSGRGCPASQPAPTMEGAAGAQTPPAPALPAPASRWGVWGIALCGCLPRTRSPPARVRVAFSRWAQPCALLPFITLGGTPSHSQVETFKPSPHSHPSAGPPANGAHMYDAAG